MLKESGRKSVIKSEKRQKRVSRKYESDSDGDYNSDDMEIDGN